ncbi:MAG: cytochrome [Bdellovibrionota bacterium]
MQHLQGDLQMVFDALYELGVIEPVLKMDWRSRLEEIEAGSPRLAQAVRVANECGHDQDKLNEKLAALGNDTLEILALEVAREYAEYEMRTEDLNDLH